MARGKFSSLFSLAAPLFRVHFTRGDESRLVNLRPIAARVSPIMMGVFKFQDYFDDGFMREISLCGAQVELLPKGVKQRVWVDVGEHTTSDQFQTKRRRHRYFSLCAYSQKGTFC